MPNYEPVCVGEKTCTRCGETKHVLAFHTDHRHLDGLQSWCRTCTSEAARRTPSGRRLKKRTAERRVREALVVRPSQQVLLSEDYDVD